MVVRPAPQRPVEFPVGRGDRLVVDTGVAHGHVAVGIELPVLVAVRAEPVAGIVVPLVGKTHGNAVPVACPQILDQPVVEFARPFARQQRDDVELAYICDVDSRIFKDRSKLIEDTQGKAPKCVQNIKEVLDDKDVDVIINATPDHWHALGTIWACQAGKDVYVEKPTSHNIWESRKMVEAARKYGRIVQVGAQNRSAPYCHKAFDYIRSEAFGSVHFARVINSKERGAIGKKPDGEPPAGVDYDMWLGPAPWAPYTRDRCHWNFRWIFDYSGGMLTDWGAHLLDGAQWGNDTEHTGPVEVEGRGVFCQGGLYDTAREYHLQYAYADGVKLFVDSGEPSLRFEGTEGWVGNRGWRGKLEASRPAILDSAIGPNDVHLYTCPGGEQRNFLDCVKSRQACYFPPEIGQRCFTIAHIGNIAMRLGRKLRWNPQEERFVNDDEANRMLRRTARSPWDLL